MAYEGTFFLRFGVRVSRAMPFGVSFHHGDQRALPRNGKVPGSFPGDFCMQEGNLPFSGFRPAFGERTTSSGEDCMGKNLWLPGLPEPRQEFFGRGGGIEDVRGGFTIEGFAGGEHFGHLFRNGFPVVWGVAARRWDWLAGGMRDWAGRDRSTMPFSHEAVFLRKHHAAPSARCGDDLRWGSNRPEDGALAFAETVPAFAGYDVSYGSPVVSRKWMSASTPILQPSCRAKAPPLKSRRFACSAPTR